MHVQGADEIFDVGQLCRRLSHCAAGEVVGLAHRTLHPPTASWPVVMHDHGPIIPHCSGAAHGGRIGRARCDLRAAPGIVTCMSGTRATVRDSILHLGAGTCMLLDDSCGDVRFEDVCFQGADLTQGSPIDAPAESCWTVLVLSKPMRRCGAHVFKSDSCMCDVKVHVV